MAKTIEANKMIIKTPNLTIITLFSFKEMVYLKHDPMQEPWMIVELAASADGALTYKLVQGKEESWHLECELSRERDEVKAVV